VSGIDVDVSGVDVDVSGIDVDVSGIDVDVSGIDVDVSGIDVDVSGIDVSGIDVSGVDVDLNGIDGIDGIDLLENHSIICGILKMHVAKNMKPPILDAQIISLSTYFLLSSSDK